MYKMSLIPSTEQNNILNLLNECNINVNVTVDAIAGSGKCHAINTKILMFDGSIKMVQNIKIGDLLLGDDSMPRKVLSLGRGIDIMYKLIPTKGKSHVFNSEHILSLKIHDKIYDIPIKNYMKLPEHRRQQFKIYRTSVEFPYRKVPFDPYIVGSWLGTNSKLPGIPSIYKINSKEIRIRLLSGILDAYGHYIIIQKNEKIIDDIIYLARSLGFSAYKSIRKTSQNHVAKFRTTISGNSKEIPCELKHKIFQEKDEKDEKDVLTTEFKIVMMEKDDYYGFTLDGNHRYLLGDFTVTHNTSTILFIADKYKDLSILVLTYNAQLKAETRKRAEKYTNLDIHSYHSFCVSNYDKSAHTDDKINEIIRLKSEPSRDIIYDMIIADESQDITPLLYKILCKILTDNVKKNNCKIVIMGDRMQSIYKFRESDSRFITFSDKIFNGFNNFEWVNCDLSETFRCTIPIVDFINNCMIGYKRLESNKKSVHKPDYIICNSYSYPCTVIKEYLKVYKPQDIFVIAFSIKDKTPIKHLANYVTNNLNVPIYCSSSDQEALDSRVIENKMVFTTIHQAKGRERKAVLFIGFDESYFEYYDKIADQKICPNELYVAVTRASEKLTIIHDSKKDYLPFLNIKLLNKYTNFQHKQTKQTNYNPLKKNIPDNGDTFTVSELISYLPFSIENLCMNYLDVKILREPDSKLDIQSVIKLESNMGGHKVEIYESVSDITGVAIPAYFEYKRLGKSSLFSKNLVERNIHRIENGNYESEVKIAMITKLKKFSKTLKDFHKNHIENIDIHKLNVNDLLKISLYYSAQQNKTDYKLRQITSFDWLTMDILEEGTNRLSDVVKGKNLVFEESVESEFFGNNVIGEIDCISKDTFEIFEFKCTKDLTVSHMIQLGIYMGICMNSCENYRYLLFNILTNELREISGTFENLQKMIKILIEHKMTDKIIKSDDIFLKEFGN